MRISVIIPVYNQKENLISTLDCLVTQTVQSKDYEVLVCDDGSDEELFSSIKRYEEKINIRYCYHSHHGFGASNSRNEGIKLAKSPLCLFLDSGMLVLNNFLEEHIKLHDKHERVVIGKYLGFEKENSVEYELESLISKLSIASLFRAIENKEKFDDRRKISFPILGRDINKWRAPWLLLWGGNFSVEKNALLSVGLFDESYTVWGGEDTDLGIRLFRKNYEFIYSEKISSIHTPHEISLTKDFSVGARAHRRRKEFFNKYHLEGMEEWQYILSEKLNEYIAMKDKKGEIKMMNSKSVVLVTGGAGFIGSHLVGVLLNNGYKVRVLDTLEFGDQGIQEFYSDPNFEFLKGDITDYSMCEMAVQDVKTVVHLASIVGEPACNRNKSLTHRVNVGGTKNILEASSHNDVQNFLFASSCSVYGFGKDTFSEDSQTNPLGIYAETKVMGEQFVKEYDNQMNCTIMRFATAFGPSKRMRFDLALNVMTANAVRNHKLSIFGGYQWRPFLSCRDIAFAISVILSSMEQKREEFVEVFNVGDNSQNIMVTNLGKIIADTVGNVEIDIDGDKEDNRSYKVSFDKLASKTGFRASVSLSEGAASIQELFKFGLITNPKSSIYIN